MYHTSSGNHICLNSLPKCKGKQEFPISMSPSSSSRTMFFSPIQHPVPMCQYLGHRLLTVFLFSLFLQLWKYKLIHCADSGNSESYTKYSISQADFFCLSPPLCNFPQVTLYTEKQTPGEENKKQLLHQGRSQLLRLPAHLNPELEQKGRLFKAIACRPIFTAVPFGSDFQAPVEW